MAAVSITIACGYMWLGVYILVRRAMQKPGPVEGSLFTRSNRTTLDAVTSHLTTLYASEPQPQPEERLAAVKRRFMAHGTAPLLPAPVSAPAIESLARFSPAPATSEANDFAERWAELVGGVPSAIRAEIFKPAGN